MNPFQNIGSAKRPRLLLPWETGLAGMVLQRPPFLPPILAGPFTLQPQFSSSFISAALKDIVQPVAAVAKSSIPLSRVIVGSVVKAIGRKKEPLPWVKADECELAVALQRWKLIVLDNPEGSRLGLQIQSANSLPGAQERIEELITDTFAGKSSKTLEQRAGSLLLYLTWLKPRPEYRGIFPFSEDSVYSYLTHLVSSKAPATRSQRFREAVGFSKGVVGAFGADEVISSKRCHGASVRSMITKRTHLQMDPFTVDQLKAYERGVFECQEEQSRIMAGNLAALSHVRGRFSDVRRCRAEPELDEQEGGTGYFEIGALETKVPRRDKKRKCLPLVGHSTGLTGLSWAREWLRLRAKHGLDAKGGPLITAIRSNGTWTSAKMRTSEAVIWGSHILKEMGSPILDGQRYGMHSHKIGLLSWCAKAGIALDVRSSLGYHASGAAESALLYARDALAGPLRELERVLLHVRSGRFNPDITRSGRWTTLSDVPSGGLQTSGFEHTASASGGSVAHDAPFLEPRPKSRPSALIPGIDFDRISEVVVPESEDECIDQVFNDSESLASEDFVFVCNECSSQHVSALSLWSCDRCSVDGCSSCMPMTILLGQAVCEACNYRLNPGLVQLERDERDLAESSSDSDSSSDESDNSEREDTAVVNAVEQVAVLSNGVPDALEPDVCYFQHKIHKTLHRMYRISAATEFLNCGRSVNSNFEELLVVPAFDWPKCKTCFQCTGE